MLTLAKVLGNHARARDRAGLSSNNHPPFAQKQRRLSNVKSSRKSPLLSPLFPSLHFFYYYYANTKKIYFLYRRMSHELFPFNTRMKETSMHYFHTVACFFPNRNLFRNHTFGVLPKKSNKSETLFLDVLSEELNEKKNGFKMARWILGCTVTRYSLVVSFDTSSNNTHAWQ